MGLLEGGIFGSAIETGGQMAINEANRQFAYNMSSTQYQRAVEDMRAAGINPMMAAGTGGASWTGGQGTNPLGGQASNINSALRAAKIEKPQADANVALKNEETKLVSEKENTERQGQKESKAREALTRANIGVAQATARNANANAQATEEEGPNRRVKNLPGRGAEQAIQDLKNHGKHKPQSRGSHVSVSPARERFEKKISAGAAYDQGRGTVYGGANSARKVSTITGRSE